MDQSIPTVANYDKSTTVPNNGGHAESNPWSRLRAGTRKRFVRESEPFCKEFENLWVFHLYFDMRFIA